ncbi:MAG: GNAT family N-acetyltransferase [Hyphomicrobiales bacterium]|nr:GNAT family N-acetyltransferase [Hyphomicrobiales bacterium]
MTFWRKPQLSIGPLSGAQAGACAAIHRASFASPWDEGEIARLIADPAVIADGAFLKDELAAFVLSRRAADEAEVLTIATHPKKRGAGAAAALLQTHLGRLAQSGAAMLFLEVDSANVAALALYRRFGFAQVGSRFAYYAKADGKRADALVMRRLL